mmetsp:Transcript_25598/g.41054  ORF Transcript_25598/g.41054 Transcript_25598/m.41054 type:complete len:330 (+) Transcript_25598:1369-2358(+)
MIIALLETITGIFLLKITLKKKQTRFSILQYLPFRNIFATIEFCSLYNFFYCNERIIGFLKCCFTNIKPGSIILVSDVIYNHLISLSHDSCFITDHISLKLTRLLREYFFSTLTTISKKTFQTISKFLNNSINKIKFNSFKFYDKLITKRNQKTIKDINDKFIEIVLMLRKNHHGIFNENKELLYFFENCKKINRFYNTIMNKNLRFSQYYLNSMANSLLQINENFKCFKSFLNSFKEKKISPLIIILFSLKIVLHFQQILTSILSCIPCNEKRRPTTLTYFRNYPSETALIQIWSISKSINSKQILANVYAINSKIKSRNILYKLFGF